MHKLVNEEEDVHRHCNNNRDDVENARPSLRYREPSLQSRGLSRAPAPAPCPTEATAASQQSKKRDLPTNDIAIGMQSRVM